MQLKRRTDFIKIFSEVQQDAEFFGLSDDVKESQNLESGLEIIFDTLKEVNPMESLIKPFVITLQEAESLKLYRIRKANVQSNIKDFQNAKDDMGLDYNFAEFFFEEEFNSSNHLKEQEKKEKQQQQKRRKKKLIIWFSCFSMTMALLVALILTVVLLNPYGARDYCFNFLSTIYYGINEIITGGSTQNMNNDDEDVQISPS